ncbi:hypothetical protein ACFFRR_010007 [Megaselia abdita]
MPTSTSHQSKQRLYIIFYSVEYFESKSFEMDVSEKVILDWKSQFYHKNNYPSNRIIDRYFMHLIVYEGRKGDDEADYWITFLNTDNVEVETSKGNGMDKARRTLRLCKRFCASVK